MGTCSAGNSFGTILKDLFAIMSALPRIDKFKCLKRHIVGNAEAVTVTLAVA